MLFYKHFKSRQIVIQLPTCLIHCPTNNMLPDTNSQHTPAFMTQSPLIPHSSFLLFYSSEQYIDHCIKLILLNKRIKLFFIKSQIDSYSTQTRY